SEMLRCFFFSSRRRHTRFSRDWSSDVCSSDLEFSNGHFAGIFLSRRILKFHFQGLPFGKCLLQIVKGFIPFNNETTALNGPINRSEERRVGKECRYQRRQDRSKSTSTRCRRSD